MVWTDELGVEISYQEFIDEAARYAEFSIVMPAYLPSLRPYTATAHCKVRLRPPNMNVDQSTNDVNIIYNWTSTIIAVKYGKALCLIYIT